MRTLIIIPVLLFSLLLGVPSYSADFSKGLTTARNTTWINAKVFSFIKRYKERKERLAFIEKEYEPVWCKMEVRWEKNEV